MAYCTGLDELKTGQSALISTLEGDGAIRDRLTDLGFTKNSRITCLFSSMWNDPRAYEVKGSVVALRKSDAQKIRCFPEGVKR